eukprot:231661_1
MVFRSKVIKSEVSNDYNHPEEHQPEIALIIGILLAVIASLIIIIVCCCYFCRKSKKGKRLSDRQKLEQETDSEQELHYHSGSQSEFDNTAPPEHINFTTEYIKVNIKTSDGVTKPLHVMNTITVGMMKQLISKYFTISERKQEITYRHKRCNSHWKIGYYNIRDGDTINVNIMDDNDDDDGDNGKELKITLKYKEAI